MHGHEPDDADTTPWAAPPPDVGDPFLDLTDDDLARLRAHPGELVEELRFGAFWFAHRDPAGREGHGRALEAAADVIERLHGHADPVVVRDRAPAAAATLRDQLAAWTDYAGRVERYLADLRALLAVPSGAAEPTPLRLVQGAGVRSETVSDPSAG